MSGRADAPTSWELAVTNYHACAGSNWAWGDFIISSSTGRFAGSFDGLSEGNGFLCAGRGVPISTRDRDIADGTSNTLAVGEIVADWTIWNWWFHSNSAASTCAIPLNHAATLQNPFRWQNNLGFASRHIGGGNFLLVDGSVRFVSNSVDVELYRNLATIAGGEVVGDW
jgi:prepilin-type processing-associated H-X9-DG protein